MRIVTASVGIACSIPAMERASKSSGTRWCGFIRKAGMFPRALLRREAFFCGYEAAYGSGLGAQIHLPEAGEGLGAGPSVPLRHDGLLFGEFTGAVLLEVPPHFDASRFFQEIPHVALGDVTQEGRFTLMQEGKTIWEEGVSNLAEIWSKPFREVLE